MKKSSSLRRSRRFKKLSYSVGDIVSISRDEMIVKGRLVSKLAGSASSNPRWMVAFNDDESWTEEEEEMYETSFGQILGKANKQEDKTTNNSGTGKSRKSTRKIISKETTPKKQGVAAVTTTKNDSADVPCTPDSTASKSKKAMPAVSSSSTEDRADGSFGKKRKKTVNFHDALASDTSLPSDGIKKAAAASAREQRSRRRQAMIEEEIQVTQGSQSRSSRPSNKKRKVDPEEEVVRINMLTGTLFLYRGRHRRAEFVRKV